MLFRCSFKGFQMKSWIFTFTLVLLAAQAHAQSVVVDGGNVRIDAPGASVHVDGGAAAESSDSESAPAPRRRVARTGSRYTPACAQAAEELAAIMKRQPRIYQAQAQSTLNLGRIQDAVVCAPSQSTVTIRRADGLVALVAQDQATLTVRSGRAAYLVAHAKDQSTVTYSGDSDQARLTALDQATVKVGRVFAASPVVRQEDQGTVDIEH
jgi:hypothetical protein